MAAAHRIHAAPLTWRLTMRQNLCATLDTTGLPSAEVPCTCMWDLVEYLSYQRLVVLYRYQATHFTVTLPHMDLLAAQRVLDEWVHSEPSESQPAYCGGIDANIPLRDHAAPFSAFPLGGSAPLERSSL
jgi:hypothetical protein